MLRTFQSFNIQVSTKSHSRKYLLELVNITHIFIKFISQLQHTFYQENFIFCLQETFHSRKCFVEARKYPTTFQSFYFNKHFPKKTVVQAEKFHTHLNQFIFHLKETYHSRKCFVQARKCPTTRFNYFILVLASSNNI